MKRLLKYLLLFTTAVCISSCATSNAIVSTSTDITKYEYIVFGKDFKGNHSLDDIIMMVQNEIANTKLHVVSALDGTNLISQGECVLSPRINVVSDIRTYITINFYDYETEQSVAVVKSSGFGLTVSQDHKIAIDSIKKRLLELFN